MYTCMRNWHPIRVGPVLASAYVGGGRDAGAGGCTRRAQGGESAHHGRSRRPPRRARGPSYAQTGPRWIATRPSRRVRPRLVCNNPIAAQWR